MRRTLRGGGDGARPRPEDLAGRPCPSPGPCVGSPSVPGGTGHRQGPGGSPPGTGRILRPDRWTQGRPGACPSPAWAPSYSKEPSTPEAGLWARGTASSASPSPSLQSPPPGRTHTSRALPGNKRPISPFPSVAAQSLCEQLLAQRNSHFCAIKRNSACSLKRNAVDQAKPMKPGHKVGGRLMCTALGC